MRKVYVFLLSLLLVFSLCACSAEENPNVRTVSVDGVVFTVDVEQGTITDGRCTYQFTVSGSSTNITYPDGSTYYWTQNEHFGHGGWSADYDANRYVDGDTLCDVLSKTVPVSRSSEKPVLIILLLLVVGVFNAAAPQASWYLEYGWRFRDAEPSELALGVNRIIGIVCIVIAVGMIFLA